jgi:hypothetical protein
LGRAHQGEQHQVRLIPINDITTIRFDFGALALLVQECKRVGIPRPLMVTGAGIRAAGCSIARTRNSAARWNDCREASARDYAQMLAASA